MKQYVGKTNGSAGWRWIGHQEAAVNGSKTKLHRAMRRYGFSSFLIETVYVSDNEQDLFRKEAEWIEKLDSKRHGYNMTVGNVYALGIKKRPTRLEKRVAKLRKRMRRRKNGRVRKSPSINT